MRFSFWIELRGAARLWTASITFIVLGALIALALPPVFPKAEQSELLLRAIQILGWTFFVLGLIVLLPMLATLYIRTKRPGREKVWHWWINFIGGVLGALAFAIPASFMFPIFLLAHLIRPNALFAPDVDAANNLWLAALFSVLGLITSVAIFFVAREKLKEDPRQGI